MLINTIPVLATVQLVIQGSFLPGKWVAGFANVRDHALEFFRGSLMFYAVLT